MEIHFYDIEWDTDGVDQNALGLPSEVTTILDKDFDVNEQGADYLSDRFGFCVKSFKHN